MVHGGVCALTVGITEIVAQRISNSAKAIAANDLFGFFSVRDFCPESFSHVVSFLLLTVKFYSV